MRLFFPLSGDDVFISYSRRDGALYAAGLADELTKRKLSCFIDKLGTEPNHDLPLSLRKKIKNCTVFVLVGTEKAAQSEFVKKEIAEFKQTGRTILPIDFDGNVGKAIWYREIPGLAVEPEKGYEALKTGNPSNNVVGFIEKSFNYTRRNQYMFRMFWSALGLFFVLIGSGIGSYLFAMNQAELAKQEADKQKNRAELQTELANKAESRAIEQEKIAKDKELLANEATKKAADAEKLVEEKTKLADEKTKAANEATKRAEDQTKKAELAKNQRQEAENRKKDAEGKALEAQNRAEIAAEREQGSSVMDISRQPGREFEAVKMIVPVAKSNFKRSQPDTQVINGLVTSVMATDYGLPLNIERNNISLVELSPDGSLLFVESGNSDNSRKWEIFNLKQNEPPFVLNKNPTKATGVSFSRNNARVAVSTDLRFFTVWDLSTKTESAQMNNNSSIAAATLDSSGEYVAYPAESKNTVIVENLNTKEKKVYLLGAELSIEKIAFYPNGDLLLQPFRYDKNSSLKNELLLCPKTNNSCVGKSLSHIGKEHKLVGVSDDGSLIMTSFIRDFKNKLVETGATIYQINDNAERIKQHLTGYRGQIRAVSLVHPQRVVISQKDALRIADVSSNPNFFALRGHNENVSNVVYSSDGKYIATYSSYEKSSNKRINVWNAKTGELLNVLEKLGSVQVLAFSKDNTKLTALNNEGGRPSVQIWNLSTGKYITPLCEASDFRFRRGVEDIVAVSFLRDDKFIATVHKPQFVVIDPERQTDAGRLIFWNSDNCMPGKVMSLPISRDYNEQEFQLGNPVEAAVFSPDGETLVTEEIAQRMYTDNTVTRIKKMDLSNIDLLSEPPQQNTNSINLQLKDLNPLIAETLFDKPPGKLKAVSFNHELRLVFETQNKDIQITKSDGSSSVALKDSFEEITEANFSLDGQRIVATNEDKQEIRIWNAVTGQTILSVNNPFFSFDKVVISPDGESFAIAGRDGVVRIYPTTPDGFFKIASEYIALLSN